MYDYNLVEIINNDDLVLNVDDKEKIDICVLNNGFPEHLIEHIRLTKKYLVNSFYYTVFNIYINEEEDKKIRDICKEQNVNIVSFRIKDRDNHLLHERLQHKLNYIYNYYVKNRGCKYFGAIQQDIYLIQELDVIKYLDINDCFGRVLDAVQDCNKIDVEGIWYLLEGFTFLKTDKFPIFSFAANFGSLPTYDFIKATGECGILSYYDYFYKYNRNTTDFNGKFKNGLGYVKINNTHKKNLIESRKYRAECIEDFGLYIHGLGCGAWDDEILDDLKLKNEKLLQILKTY